MATLDDALIELPLVAAVSLAPVSASAAEPKTPAEQVLYQTVKIDGLDIFYREAGPKDAPAVLLLHGFPTSSHMFRELIPALADKYHVVAPDYPGFGNSSAPSVEDFEYTFDSLARVMETFSERVGLKQYSIYLMDYGAPVGFRLATRHPERIQALIIQNGNAYEEGLDNEFWKPIKAQRQNRTKEQGDKLRPLITREPRSGTPTACGTSGRSTLTRGGMCSRFWIAPAIRRSSWRSSTATAETRPCTRRGRRT